MEPGVYIGMSNEDYHSGPGVNKGLLDVVARSPLHAKWLLDAANEDRPEPTEAMKLGTALHTLVLEPEAFADLYVCELTQADAPHAIADRDTLVRMVDALNEGRLDKLATSGTKDELVARILAAYVEMDLDAPQVDFGGFLATRPAKDLKAEIEGLNERRPGKLRTTGTMAELAAILAEHGQPVTLWQDVKARWAAENEGYTVLSVDTYEQLLGMRDAIMAHPAASKLLAGEGINEASIYWIDPLTDELCRCRPDRLRANGIIVDLKSTEDASPEGFARSLINYRYHVQPPWYLTGALEAHAAGWLPAGYAQPQAFVFIAVEKKPPYAVACYALDAESLQIGRQLMRADLDTLHQCKKTGIWPGYGDGIQMLGVPEFYLKRHAHLVDGAA